MLMLSRHPFGEDSSQQNHSCHGQTARRSVLFPCYSKLIYTHKMQVGVDIFTATVFSDAILRPTGQGGCDMLQIPDRPTL